MCSGLKAVTTTIYIYIYIGEKSSDDVFTATTMLSLLLFCFLNYFALFDTILKPNYYCTNNHNNAKGK